MNNYIILKWGSLKSYNFTDDFFNQNKEVVNELHEVWDDIYNNSCCSATGGSKYLQSKPDLKIKLVNVLEKIYNLGVPIQNGWSDEYYNNFQEIKDYILNYNN